MATPAPQLRHPVRLYFEGPTGDWAVKALRAYCSGLRENGDWLYSGAWFDRLADPSHPDAFTAEDLVAISMLSVSMPAQAAIRILKTGCDVYSGLLRSIGPDRPIWEADRRDLETDSPADALWHLLVDLDDVGPVIAGKLMAAKRPSLIPVYDQHVEAALGPPPLQFWAAMQVSMIEAHEAVSEAVVAAGVHVVPLRAVDIVVWMHQHGWNNAPHQIDAPPRLI